MMNQNRLIRTLERHEAVRLKPYLCPAGYLTIGIGRNLDGKGITYSEARYMLKNDLDECRWDLEGLFPGQFDCLPDHVQEVLVNMRFQLGTGGFRSFKRFIAAVRGWDFVKAQKEMLDSKWAKTDTPERAQELAEVLRHGWPDTR
jgi:lysozyme